MDMASKRIIVMTLAVVVALLMSCVSLAEELETPEIPIDPDEYQYTDYAYATCSVSGGVATAGVRVSGKTGVTKIVTTYTLQKKNGGSWTNVSGATWSKTTYAQTQTLSASKSVGSGIYRTKASIKVYKGTPYDSITVHSSSVTY